MLELTTIQQISIWIIPVLFAITLHEASHGLVAYHFGDPTAKQLGRISFSPLRHIDLIGTIVVPILILVLSRFNFVFGWAKPVPVNQRYLHHPRRDMALVALAGPLANLIMAFFWAALLKIGSLLDPQHSALALFLMLTGRAGIIINLVLAFLNLLPLPPLDGSRIISSILPPRQAFYYEKIRPFGFFILLILLLTGLLGWLLNPLLKLSLVMLRTIFFL